MAMVSPFFMGFGNLIFQTVLLFADCMALPVFSLPAQFNDCFYAAVNAQFCGIKAQIVKPRITELRIGVVGTVFAAFPVYLFNIFEDFFFRHTLHPVVF